MAQFIAAKIIGGSQDYAQTFAKPFFHKYQEDVDTILIAEGREDLIVK